MTSEERDEGSLRLLAALGDIDDRFVMEAACPEATGSAGKQADASKGDSETELAQEGDRQNGAATAKVQVNMPADVASDAMPEAEGCGVAPVDMLAHTKPETEGPDDVSAGKAPRSAPVEKASVDVSPGKAKGKVLRFTPERVRVLAGVGIAACLLVAGAIVFARPEMLGLNNPGPSEPAMMRDQTSDTLSPEEAAPEAAMPEDVAADSEDAGVMAASESAVMALSDDGDQGVPLARAVQDAEEGEVAQDAVAASGAVTTLANPWQECASMAQAESLAGFSLAISDSALPEGYGPEATCIQAIEGSMLEVNYNGECGGSVCLRKAVGTDDVSGDYNSYDLTQTSCIAGQDVTLRGAENAWYLATWTSDGYSFAVVSTSALTTSQVEALVVGLT